MSALRLLESKPPRLLHPAFDLQGNVLTYGFRVEQADVQQTTRTTFKALHVVSVAGAVEAIEGNIGTVDGRTLRHRDAPKEHLPILDTQWSQQDLVDFLDDPKCLPGPELYQRLVAALRKYVDFDHDGAYTIIACWALMTFVYPTFSAVPFLHLLGEKGTGKSQALDVLQELTRQGYKSQATPAVVGDLVESKRVTLLFDQADNMKDQHVDLFTDSYRAGARRTIVDMENRGNPHEFETFGPKAFAGVHYLHYDLADRVILIATSPTIKTVPPITEGLQELKQLRAECYRWSLLEFHKLRKLQSFTDSEWPGLTKYRGRQRELWQPIECMMEALAVPEADREAARAYYRRSQSSTRAEVPDDKVDLLRELQIGVGEDEVWETTSEELLEQLNADQPPAAEPGFGDTDTKWTPQRLGTQLRSLNVLLGQPRRIRGNQARRYMIDGGVVRSVCRRYGLTE
jgi:hypothetical protein